MQLRVWHRNLVGWWNSQPLENISRISILKQIGSNVTAASDTKLLTRPMTQNTDSICRKELAPIKIYPFP